MTRTRRYGDLDRETVVAAALRVGSKVGFDALSMRNLADELGVSPMTSYRYVPGKRALLDLVIDAVLEGVEVPPPSAGTWDERLRMLERSVRRELRRYPGLREQLTRPTPHATRLADAAIGILLEAGFDDATATLAFSALYAYMLGQLEIDENAAASRARPRRRNAFSGVAPRAEPLHPDDIFEFGFDLMLDALRRKLPAR